MSEHMDRRQSWFGLVALIICGIIVAGLLFPALLIDRHDRRRPQCENNLRNLALATINFEASKKHYPGHQALFGNTTPGRGKLGSWVVSLLPQIEQQALRDVWDDPTNLDRWSKAITQEESKLLLDEFYPQISLMICSSDVNVSTGPAPTSYAANTGFYLTENDPALVLDVYQAAASASERSTIAQRGANGLFCNRFPEEVWNPATGQVATVFGTALPITSSDVRDGTSQTILIGEQSNGLSWRDYSITDDSARFRTGIVWLYAGQDGDPGRPAPIPLTKEMSFGYGRLLPEISPQKAHPSSLHQGISNVAFADGSTVSLNDEIDYHVYQALMTPNTRQSDVPHPAYILKDQDFRQ